MNKRSEYFLYYWAWRFGTFNKSSRNNSNSFVTFLLQSLDKCLLICSEIENFSYDKKKFWRNTLLCYFHETPVQQIKFIFNAQYEFILLLALRKLYHDYYLILSQADQVTFENMLENYLANIKRFEMLVIGSPYQVKRRQELINELAALIE